MSLCKNNFEGNEVAIQVIARGAYLDTGTWPGEIYPVEVTTIRLNHIALERWYQCKQLNTRNPVECAEDEYDYLRNWAERYERELLAKAVAALTR